jgi:hypothetical protein
MNICTSNSPPSQSPKTLCVTLQRHYRMTDRKYNLLLDNILIGTTLFENADAPMNVVFGQIHFIESDFGYDKLKKYCTDNGVSILSDYPEDNFIATDNITSLTISDQEGNFINSEVKTIEGMDNDFYTLNLLGVPTEQYENYFPKHIVDYQNRKF